MQPLFSCVPRLLEGREVHTARLDTKYLSTLLEKISCKMQSQCQIVFNLTDRTNCFLNIADFPNYKNAMDNILQEEYSVRFTFSFHICKHMITLFPNVKSQ